MAVYSLAPTIGFGFQAFSNGGLPLAGGLIYSYIDGGTELQSTYTTAQGATANTNPIVLDDAGRPPNNIWLDATTSYRFVLTDSDGNQIRTFDSIPHINYATGTDVYHQFSVQPTDATPNVSISPSVKVTLYNFDGSINTAVSGSITVALGANPSGATLSGTVTQLLVSGVATYNDLKLNKVGLNYTLLAGAIGIDAFTAESVPFDMTATLAFTTQPSASTSTVPISPAVVVTARSSDASTVTSFTGNVTIALGTNPGGALSGTVTVAAVAGVATFSNLIITGAVGAYTLVATGADASLITGTSNSFVIMGTVFNTLNYTAVSGGFFTPDRTGTQVPALTFYNGVVWANEQSGGSPNIIDVFNFTAGTPLIFQQNFGAGSANSRWINGAINQQSTPPGRITSKTTTETNVLYAMTFDGTTSFFNDSLPFIPVYRVDEDDSVNAIFCEYEFIGHRIGKWTNVNFAAHTATFTGTLADPGYLAFNSCAVDSRCYIRSPLTAVAWLHTTTDVLTTIRSYANSCSLPLVGGQFGGGPTTNIYVQSGTTNQANRLQKLDTDGGLVAEATLSSIGTTSYNTITTLAYDYVNSFVWAQSTVGIHCVETTTMTEVAFIATASLTTKLLQPIGHQSGGVFAYTAFDGTYWGAISRLYPA